MEAPAGNNPSFVWRSLLAGKDLIKHGLAKIRIGDGRQTRIWYVPWLHDRDDPSLITPLRENYRDMNVSALLRPDGERWYEATLRNIFEPNDVDRIIKTPVNPNLADEWYWRFDVRGSYTVRSGYRLLTNLPQGNNGFKAWRKLWNLEVATKIRNLLWRCVKEILPVRATLRKRRVEVQAECPVCGSGEETVSHIFLECAGVAGV